MKPRSTLYLATTIAFLGGFVVRHLLDATFSNEQSVSPDHLATTPFSHQRTFPTGPESFALEPRSERRKVADLDHKNQRHPLTLSDVRKARASLQRPKFDLFGPDGVITEQAIREFELDEADQLELQAAVEQLLSEMRDNIKDNIQPDLLRTNEQAGIRALKIPRFDSTDAFTKFSSSVTNRFGQNLGSKILISSPEGVYFGGLGEHDVGIEVFEKDEKDDDFGYHVTVTSRDPESGKMVSQTTTHSALMDRRYPGVFDLDMKLK